MAEHSSYKQLTDSLRSIFSDSQKTYLKNHLKAKMRCYESKGLRENYYTCIEAVDDLMKENSMRLKKDIDSAEWQQKECLQKEGMEQQKCRAKLHQKCVSIYKQFYKQSGDKLKHLEATKMNM